MTLTLGAQTLPVAAHRVEPERAKPPASDIFLGGAKVIGESIPGVLMLRSSALSHHAVRAAARQAGLSLTLEFIENRREFLDEFRRGCTDVIIAGPESLPDLPLREVLDRARSAEPAIPVLVTGGHFNERDVLRIVREGATEYLNAGDLDRLPAAITRAVKVREAAALQRHARQELEHAALMLRENQKLITVGRLAASIAHEINNPLESIANLLFLLGEEKDMPASARGYLQLAQRELDRVAQISRQTLKFSREAAGPTRAHIDELLEEVLSLYSRRIAEKNLHVERQYNCPEEAVVYPGEMRQVLSNLVTNAIEASSMNGRLRLRLRSSRSWSDPGVRGIRIAIGDNGSGIDPVVQRRLGEPFFTTKGQRGTGLGLWVTRSIVQRWGGEIQLRSSVDPERHGTVFSIFLPTNMRPRIVDNAEHAPTQGGSGGRGTGTAPKERTGFGGGQFRADPARRFAGG